MSSGSARRESPQALETRYQIDTQSLSRLNQALHVQHPGCKVWRSPCVALLHLLRDIPRGALALRTDAYFSIVLDGYPLVAAALAGEFIKSYSFTS